MAFGTVANGSDNRVNVGTSQGSVNVLVGGLQNWEYGGTADTSTEDFYNDFPSIITVGEPVRTGSGSGKFADADSGLAIIKNAFESQAVMYHSWAPNGTDGEGLPCRVSEFRLTGSGRNTAANYNYSVVQAADPFDVGGGLS